jgi:hypothetical protein
MFPHRVHRLFSTLLGEPKQNNVRSLQTHTQFSLRMRSSVFNRGVEQMEESLSIGGKNSLYSTVL